MADLGCGSGILPIVLSELGDFKGNVHSFDSLTNCIESTKLNSKIFGLNDKVNAVEMDLVEIYYPKTSKFTEN
jgi:tRNA A58 N-methylase Trm61